MLVKAKLRKEIKRDKTMTYRYFDKPQGEALYNLLCQRLKARTDLYNRIHWDDDKGTMKKKGRHPELKVIASWIVETSEAYGLPKEKAIDVAAGLLGYSSKQINTIFNDL